MSRTAKVVRLTEDGQVLSGRQLVAGVQVVGGSGATSIYNATSAVAASKVASVTGGTMLSFPEPVLCDVGVYVDAAADATEVLVHLV
jgi:nitrous oxide reductase accessory protein NosL